MQRRTPARVQTKEEKFMSDMSESTKSALDNAYKAQVINLYSALAEAFYSAKDDEAKIKKVTMKEAIMRYKQGLYYAKLTYKKAIKASNITKVKKETLPF